MSFETVEAEIIRLGETGSYMLWPVPLPRTIHAEDVYESDQRPFAQLPDGAEYTQYLYDEPSKKFIKKEG